MQTNKAIARSNKVIRRINREFGQSIALLSIDATEDTRTTIDGLCAKYECEYDHVCKGAPLDEHYCFAQ